MHDEYVFKVYVILFSMRNNHYHSHVPVDKWLMLNKLHNNYMHKLNGDKVGTMPSQKTWNALIWVSCLHWCIICMFVWWMQPQNSLFHLYLFRSLSLCLCLRAFVNIDVCVSLSEIECQISCVGVKLAYFYVFSSMYDCVSIVINDKTISWIMGSITLIPFYYGRHLFTFQCY